MQAILLILIGLIGLGLLINENLDSKLYQGLGPLQTQWVKSLIKNPERQTTKVLGYKTHKGYKACCLGEIHIIGCSYFNQKSPFDENGSLKDYHSSSILSESFSKYGLRSAGGLGNDSNLNSLSYFNDNGESWYGIAKRIINDPSNFLTKEV